MRSLLFILLFVASASFAQQGADDPVKRTIAAIQETLKQRPEDATLWFYLARFQAQAGDKDASLASLQKVLDYGDGFLPSREFGFEKLWDDARFQDLRARMESRLPRLDTAPTAIEIDDRTLLPEGIAYDRPSHSFFMGSVQGKILRIEEGGATTVFAGPESKMDPLLGLAVDAPRRILYAVSTSALTEAGRKQPRNAIFAFEVDSRKLVRRVEVPGAVQLNDVAIAPGGRVFTTDSGSGAIYEIPKEGPPRTLVAPNIIRGANGLAAAPDGKHLYVAHSTGIAVVDVETGAWKRVTLKTRENVSGIDGLYEWQGQLIGVQNITTPGRVVVITLSHDGESVTKVQTLLSHHHNVLDQPTTGVVTERGFFLLAATGITHYNDKGEITEPEKVPKPAVVRIPLPR